VIYFRLPLCFILQHDSSSMLTPLTYYLNFKECPVQTSFFQMSEGPIFTINYLTNNFFEHFCVPNSKFERVFFYSFIFFTWYNDP